MPRYRKEGTTPFWFWNIYESTYFHFLLDGEFFVNMFFVLSGFVLTISFFNGGGKDASILVKGMFKRYSRLIIPV
jgi:peptidoglycan/LPS O-acetylase OafA/YrhL